jgi:hypothetical protein
MRVVGRSDGKHWLCMLVGLHNKKELHRLDTKNKLRTNPSKETMMLKLQFPTSLSLYSAIQSKFKSGLWTQLKWTL